MKKVEKVVKATEGKLDKLVPKKVVKKKTVAKKKKN